MVEDSAQLRTNPCCTEQAPFPKLIWATCKARNSQTKTTHGWSRLIWGVLKKLITLNQKYWCLHEIRKSPIKSTTCVSYLPAAASAAESFWRHEISTYSPVFYKDKEFNTSRCSALRSDPELQSKINMMVRYWHNTIFSEEKKKHRFTAEDSLKDTTGLVCYFEVTEVVPSFYSRTRCLCTSYKTDTIFSPSLPEINRTKPCLFQIRFFKVFLQCVLKWIHMNNRCAR